MDVTAIIITKNNEKTISKTLDSLDGYKIIIGDRGSQDGTIELCRKANVVKIQGDLSECKNTLLSMAETDWVLDINPNEALVGLIPELPQASYYVNVVNGKLITKEARLLHKSSGLMFSGRIFPSINEASLNVANIWINSIQIESEDFSEEADRWIREEPLNHEPYYYKAYIDLKSGKYDSFLAMAERYLAGSSIGMSAFLTKYYMSMIELRHNKNASKAIRHLLPCIAVNPCMAEFWCLLGDIFCYKKQYEKAVCFYENAILLGGRRKRNDLWPIEVDKYKNYPEKMIQKCRRTGEKEIIVTPTRIV